MKLSTAQVRTLLALSDIGGWATYPQLVAHDGNSTSAAILEQYELMEQRQISTETMVLHEVRLTKQGREWIKRFCMTSTVH